jgi:transposase
MNTNHTTPVAVSLPGSLFQDDLAPDLDVASTAKEPGAQPTPRLRYACRDQHEFRDVVLDRLLPPDHQVRLVWDYVCKLDLSCLLQRIRAVAGAPGRNATDPRILFCLWLYATVEGIGSARLLEQLCEERLPFMWICGGVHVNHHLLSDFRVADEAVLDQQLTHSVAVLRLEGLVDLTRVAQDGMRVRASAGAASFRRRGKLTAALQEAKDQVQRLKKELQENPGATHRQQQAAQERAGKERVERLEHALQELAKVEQAVEKRGKESKEKARASTTDPEARKMKMADGGFRPAYNVQFATDTESRLIVGVDVTNQGSDGGKMGPMLDQLDERYQKSPDECLVDGGFASGEDINYAATVHGTKVFAPVREKEKKQKAGKDPFAPLPGDKPAVAEWRRRMGTPEAQELYKLRCSTAEWSNAQARNRGLYQLQVRGLAKVRAALIWYVLAHNLVQGQALRAARAQAEATGSERDEHASGRE